MPVFETYLTPDRIDRLTGKGIWGDRLLSDVVDEHAGRDPGKLAIVDSRGSCTFAQLRTQSIRCAYGLLSLGLKAGDVISLQLPNWKEWTILHIAACRIGVVTNPLVPIFRERELTYMLGLSEAKLLVVPSTFRNFDHAAMALRLRAALPHLEHVMVVGDDCPGEAIAWEAFIASPWEAGQDPAILVSARPDPNDITEIIFTSGTTGDPKGVLHTHNTLISSQNSVSSALGLDQEAVLHIASTFGHQTGVLSGVRLPLQLGATAIYQDVWMPDTLLELIETHRITMTSGSPTFLQDLLRAPDIGRRDLSSLRIFRCGGAPIPRVLINEAKEKLPGLSVHSAWGQTESAIVTLTRPEDPLAKIVGTDGYPLPGMEIRVVDAIDTPLPPGTEGRLQCRGHTLFVGYAKRPEETSQSFAGSWFDTGDVATIDVDGFVRITGRTKDIIIRGGENIPVTYIENILYEDARLRDVAVIGVPDPRLGERACAVVSLRAAADPYGLAELREHLKARGVAKQYWPESVRVIDEMPRAPNGKIRKQSLKEGAT